MMFFHPYDSALALCKLLIMNLKLLCETLMNSIFDERPSNVINYEFETLM